MVRLDFNSQIKSKRRCVNFINPEVREKFKHLPEFKLNTTTDTTALPQIGSPQSRIVALNRKVLGNVIVNLVNSKQADPQKASPAKLKLFLSRQKPDNIAHMFKKENRAITINTPTRLIYVDGDKSLLLLSMNERPHDCQDTNNPRKSIIKFPTTTNATPKAVFDFKKIIKGRAGASGSPNDRRSKSFFY